MGLRDEYDRDATVTAFILVFAAGGATAIGAAAVFFPSLVKLASKRTLAASLGLAAGVMLYVSLVDIYGKAIGGFEDQGHEEGDAFIYATICFFMGIVVMMVLNFVVGLLMGKNSMDDLFAFGGDQTELDQPKENNSEDDENGEANPEAITDSTKSEEARREALQHMGLANAVAIALHNFPEGLVTFISYMEDPTVGIVLAVGIGIHNIPEGLCVAMPIYYATGDRTRAFLWAILSGVSEPFGALIGYFALGSSFSGNTNGVLFGLVAGIMAYLAVDELLPSAHKYDPSNKVVTWTVILGMLAIAGSLMLFSV